MAAGKLQEVKWIPQRPVTYPVQNLGNFAAARSRSRLRDRRDRERRSSGRFCFPLIVVLALAFGVLLIIPIGGADMPTVIAILNRTRACRRWPWGSCSITSSSSPPARWTGRQGLILSIIMCKAMNRSFTNVLFGAFGQVTGEGGGGRTEARTSRKRLRAPPRSWSRRNLVVIVPGYGMAVAQAQHRVRELYDQLTKRGVDVRFAIHPVAGRMPGHMNVLLAEAEIPYDELVEMDDINPDMPSATWCW